MDLLLPPLVRICQVYSCIGLFQFYDQNFTIVFMQIKELTGLRIKELRRAKGMSQEMLAEKTGISSKYLSSIERGKENPTLETLIRLAEALSIELAEVFNFSHEGKSAKELRVFITDLLKSSSDERLKLTAKIVKAINS